MEIKILYSLLWLFHLWAAPVLSSYLQRPRIHFVGQFRNDAPTLNNVAENFIKEDSLLEKPKKFFLRNPQGTCIWTLINCRVTSVVLENGLTLDDEIVGKEIVINPQTAPPKLVDPHPTEQKWPTIYGMRFGINWDHSQIHKDAFIGDFVPAAVSRDLWPRQTQYTSFRAQPLGARTVSHLTNIQWADQLTSKALMDLRKYTTWDQENGYSLSIAFALFNYTVDKDEDLFLHGNIVGSIGIVSPKESLLFPENRVMEFMRNPPLPIPPWTTCNQIENWASTVHFDTFESMLTLDLSNSLPLDISAKLCHLYPLFVGVLTDELTVDIIHEIPYMENNWYKETAGIYEIYLSYNHLKLAHNHKVVVVIFKQAPFNTHNRRVSVCSGAHETSVHSKQQFDDCVYIVLKETPYLVRPMNEHIFKLEKGDSVEVKLKVKHYGRSPSEQLSVRLCDASPSVSALRSGLEYMLTQKTDKSGIATFNFIAGDVGTPSKVIDGQEYRFYYCVHQECEQCQLDDNTELLFFVWSSVNYSKPYYWDTHVKPILSKYYKLFPVMRDIVKLNDYDDVTKQQNIELILFSMSLDVNHPNYMPVTRDLSPTKKKMIIDWLKSYDHARNPQDKQLYQSPEDCQKSYVFHEEQKAREQSDYSSWSYHNTEHTAYGIDQIPSIFSNSITARSFSAISTVRIQSASKLSDWITDNDCFLKKTCPTKVYLDFISKWLTTHSAHSLYTIWHLIKNLKGEIAQAMIKAELQLLDNQRTTRAANLISAYSLPSVTSLPSWYTNNHCSVSQLRKYLQIALELEFAVIPPYLTALYSIKDGYNQEVYEVIRSVVMQEMLHLAQVANLLIAIGGNPIIDSPQTAPSYPGKLPGGVLPGLNVTLQKASPRYIADVFMMIEFPHEIVYTDPNKDKEKEGITHALTIGKLYESIKNCMIEAHKRNPESFFVKGAASRQITWPWSTHEEGLQLRTVTNIQEAKEAINMIVEQGEGTEQRDPTYSHTTELAHFFKFEMLACKHHIRILHDHEQYIYDFRGKEIQFTSEGVWPMQNNPSSKHIPTGSPRVYHEAKVFHSLYRALLRSLQATFDGHPKTIKEAVPIMEDMRLQAKRLMQLELPASPGHSKQTCGPIFDYHWNAD